MSIAGKMRERADIYEPIKETDSRGEVDPAYGKPYLKGVPCSIKQLSSSEQDAARQAYAAATYEVKMYADRKKPIGHTFWLLWEGKRLEVASAVLDERGMAYTLTCGEVVA